MKRSGLAGSFRLMRNPGFVVASLVSVSVVLGISLGPQVSARADVNDFTFDSFSATYELGRDSESGMSTLRVVETLVALFPEIDQNRGIQRAIPNTYRGIPTETTMRSVMDADGNPRAFTEEEDGEFDLVTIRDETFVHGLQTYVIDYSQTNVILEPDSSGAPQEFYWDINGTGWSQPFGRVSARVIIPTDIASGLNGDVACYQGYAGDTTPCENVTRSMSESGATVIDFTSTNLGPGQNLTVAIGFRSGTFAMPDRSVFASLAGWLFASFAALFYGLVVLLIILRLTRWANARGRGIVIAEYGAPDGVTPLLAAQVYGKSRRAVAAAIVDLAVRRLVTLRDTDAEGRRGSFTVTRSATQATDIQDQATLRALFGDPNVEGSEISTRPLDPELGKRLVALRKQASMDALRLGWVTDPDSGFRIAAIILLPVLGVAMWLSGSAMSEQGFGGNLPVFALTGGWVALVAMAYSVWTVRKLTKVGAAVRDSLKGLKLFIRLAEADRIRVLQSPEGALRVPIDTSKRDTMVKLTERVLPYAILFGIEDEWSKVLGDLYSESTSEPSWWHSNSGFNAVAFAAGLASFTQSTSSMSWAGSSSSSSSGGSSGGGSSGGGGGGGGGGGV